jgi:4-hydroxy-tetrahydrodipicolinate reductase
LSLLILGKGKTGSLVAEVARERGHKVSVLDSKDNAEARALTRESLNGVDAVIDFTMPEAVLKNVSACARLGTNVVIGTTGWYSEIPYVRKLVEENKTGLIYGSNFSVGVNTFFDIARAAGSAAAHGYTIKIVERHHQHKKDSPSGTAASLQQVIKDASETEAEITSIREGETIGTHVILLDSPNDTMMLVHDAKSRRGFAEGAVKAAEWLKGKKGFYDFREIFKELN